MHHSELSTEDVLNLCGHLMDGAADASRFRNFLEAFAAMMGAERGTFGAADLTAQAVTFHVGLGFDDERIVRDYAPFMHNDPRNWWCYGNGRAFDVPASLPAERFNRMAAGDFYVVDELCPRDVLERHPIYPAFLEQHRLGSSLVGMSMKTEGLCNAIAICRYPDAEPFSAQDAALATLAAPMSHAATRTFCHFHQLREDAARARLALDNLGLGLAFLDQSARLVYENEAFKRLRESTGAFREAKSILSCRDERSQTAFLGALSETFAQAEADSDDFGAPLRVHCQREQSPLTAFLTTIRPVLRDPFYDQHLRRYALLVVSDPEQALNIAPPRLMALFDITRAEARVLALLVAGLKLELIAERLNLADSTIRSHIKSLLRKLGVSRQSALIKLVLNSPLSALSESLLSNAGETTATVNEIATQTGDLAE